MKIWRICLVLLLLPAAVSAQQVVQQRPIILQLDVDAQGQVSTAKVMPPTRNVILIDGQQAGIDRRYGPVPDVLAKAAVKVATKWRFKAPRENGKAVPGRTWAYATLQLIKRADGNYGVNVRYVRNGPYISQDVTVQPSRRMMRLGRASAVVAEATVQKDGTVGDVRILKAINPEGAYDANFADVVRRSLLRWKGEPMRIDGKAVASNIRLPMVFLFPGTSKAERSKLEQEVRDVVKPPAGSGPLQSGQALVMDNPFVKQPAS